MEKTTKKRRFLRLKEFWRRLKKNKLAIVGLCILCFLVLVAIFADFIATHDYAEQDLLNQYKLPSKDHYFGTDKFGRDIFSRVVHGSRISLTVGFISVGIALVFGSLIGAIAGYFSARVDNILMRLMDILLAIPQILLAIAISASLGTGLTNLMIAVGISSIPQYARIMRAAVLSLKDQQFIEATKAAGGSNFRTIFVHIIPNCLAPIIVQATLGVAFAILTAAGLSFIGLGLDPGVPEWGAMLSEGRDYIRDFPHMTLFPGLAIMITILSLNLLGDGFRDALDPKLRD
ncbi:MAG: ABC transporter permease [Eubacteriales bacterium]|nr:ABC transporter permease [Clostridiales bacterium]MDY5836822.1 ABC transporter permease [Eubacteriales bacterium]